MIVKSLLGEFLYEAESTRKLLKAIPDSALDFKPSEKSWSTAELASHIAGIYDWYAGTIEHDEFDLGTYGYQREDHSKMENILAKFEENVKKAQASLENASDEQMMLNWRLLNNGHEVIPSMPRIQAVRSFLFNHIYHHRGEMIVYLRSTGNKVPGLYGPVAEDSGKF